MSDDSNDVSSLFKGTPEFEGEPPLPTEPDYGNDHIFWVRLIGDWLTNVAEGEDRAYHLSHVLGSVERRARAAGKSDKFQYLTKDERATLKGRVFAARRANPSMFWENNDVTRQITRHGFDALLKLIDLWAEDEFERWSYTKDQLADLYDYARIFRNLLHNIDLAEGIEARLEKRAAQDIAKIRSMALGAPAATEATE